MAAAIPHYLLIQQQSLNMLQQMLALHHSKTMTSNTLQCKLNALQSCSWHFNIPPPTDMLLEREELTCGGSWDSGGVGQAEGGNAGSGLHQEGVCVAVVAAHKFDDLLPLRVCPHQPASTTSSSFVLL